MSSVATRCGVLLSAVSVLGAACSSSPKTATASSPPISSPSPFSSVAPSPSPTASTIKQPSDVFVSLQGYYYVSLPGEVTKPLRRDLEKTPSWKKYYTGVDTRGVVRTGQTEADAAVIAIGLKSAYSALPGIFHAFAIGVAESSGAKIQRTTIAGAGSYEFSAKVDPSTKGAFLIWREGDVFVVAFGPSRSAIDSVAATMIQAKA